MANPPAAGAAPVWLDAPEFKAAVAAAVAESTAKIVAQIAATGGEPKLGEGDLVNRLALAIAELTHQGTGRKPVDPLVLHRREQAGAAMVEAIIEARRAGETPIYRLRHKVYLPVGSAGEAVIEPMWIGNDHIHYPTEIGWPGVPNEAMIPANEPAQRIFSCFAGVIGNTRDTAAEAWERGAEAPNQFDDGIALTPGGVAVRGSAAATVMRSGPGAGRNPEAPQVGQPGHRGLPAEEAATIRRHQPSPKTLINVLGTIAAPAEQNG